MEKIKHLYRISGLRYVFGLLGLSYLAGYFVCVVEKIKILSKSKIDKLEKERGIQFLKEPNFESKLIKLNSGKIDNESVRTINLVFDRYLFMATHEFQEPFEKKEISEQFVVKKFMKNIDKIYQLPVIQYESNVFYYHCGLNIFNNKDITDKIKSYINSKDFIDAGAFVGDSALLFIKEYKAQKVFCFEPENKNYDLLLRTIETNQSKKIIPIKKGVGDVVDKKASITSSGSISHILPKINANIVETIELTTIDEFVNTTNNLSVGLIKMDIEGYEFKAIKGAMSTIIKHKPILLISIYHSPTDFFEIKPYIEQLNLNYKFFIRKINPFTLVSETMLICVPEELLIK